MRRTLPRTWQNAVRREREELRAASVSTKPSLPIVPTSTVSPFLRVATTDNTASIGKSTWFITEPTDCVNWWAASSTV